MGAAKGGRSGEGGGVSVFTRVSHKDGIKIINSFPPTPVISNLGRGAGEERPRRVGAWGGPGGWGGPCLCPPQPGTPRPGPRELEAAPGGCRWRGAGGRGAAAGTMAGLCGGGAAGSARLPLCSGSWVLSRAPGCDGRQRAWVERVHGGGSGSRRPQGQQGRGCGGLVPLVQSLKRSAPSPGCCGALRGCPWVLQVTGGDKEQRDPRMPCLQPL